MLAPLLDTSPQVGAENASKMATNLHRYAHQRAVPRKADSPLR
jgi:hypothetical protein